MYLHDTDKPELFEKEKRSFSSGCTRVSDIGLLIQQLIQQQGISIEPESEQGPLATRTLELNRKIPIYFVYFTAWPDSSGRVRFREDIYSLDSAMFSWF